MAVRVRRKGQPGIIRRNSKKLDKMKYTQNLRVEGNKVYSYSTHVATIDGAKLLVHGHWSTTTSKHVNYVAKEYGLTKIESPKDKEPEPTDNPLKSIAFVAMMGDIFGKDIKEKNDWKKRMLKAGCGQGLNLPDDFDTLSEEEKARRLDGAIDILSK